MTEYLLLSNRMTGQDVEDDVGRVNALAKRCFAGDVDGAINRHLRDEADEEALCFSIVRDYALRFGSAV